MQKKNKPPAYVVGLWLSLRLLTSFAAALFSKIRPLTPLEEKIVLWPPTEIQSWLERVFLAPWLRWDVYWYVQILTIGYTAGDGTTSFHPLYLLLSAPLYQLGCDPLFSLIITSSLAALFTFRAIYKLAALDLSGEKSFLATLLFASFPVSFILFAPYTESTFLLFSTLALYTMRQRRWFLATIATLLASLTRQQGVFLIFPILWYAWEDSGKSIKGIIQGWQGWLAAASAPAGLLLWAAYRLFYLKEGVVNFQNLQGFIYSVLLSPSVGKVVPDHTLMLPWKAFVAALARLLEEVRIGDMMTMLLGGWFLVLLIISWKHIKPAERLYSIVITVVSFSMSTGASGVYFSLPRHLIITVPVFIGAAAALNKRWQKILLIGLQFCIQFFMLFLYVLKAWVP